MKASRWLLVLLIVCSSLGMSAPATAAPPAPPVATPVSGAALNQLSTYDITASLDPNGSITGTERLHYINATGQPLDEIAFRLYPNADYYGKGSLTVNSIIVDGKAITPRYSVENTVMEASLPKTLHSGGAADLDIHFTTVMPVDSTGSFGILTRHSDTGDWIVSDWNPIVAGRDAKGWRFDPPGPGGDPTFSDAALYSVKIAAPPGMTIIASGGATKQAPKGTQMVWTVERQPLREFTFIASSSLQRFDREVGAHVVSAYLHSASNQAAISKLTLDASAASLSTYESLFGPYPLHELDVIDVPLLGALGVSWTGLLFINGGLLFPKAEANPTSLQFTIAHEVSHQWWGALVGSNTNDHAFLAEGMANCSAVLVFLANDGLAAAKAQLDLQIVRPYERALDARGDGVVDRPSSLATPGPSLPVLIYAKAAIGFLAIREAIGAGAFSAALTAYANDYRWRVSGPADLRAEFQAQTSQDISPLWRLWFESAAVTGQDVQAVVDAMR